jgi:Fe(3+) dicitrate transport protein
MTMLLASSTALFALASTSSVSAQHDQGDPERAPQPQIIVTGTLLPKGPQPAKLDHIMREVDGTRITVTKKTTVIKLDQQPTVIGNNQRELFARAPGVSISEQQTPTQFNISYRGIGNPQESEYVQVLRDGLPIQSDWIGFPTLYYVPLPQSIAEVQLIRGGSSLIYGPQPAPAINFVSRRPRPDGPALTGYSEHVGGSDHLYSTYNAVEGATNGWEYRADFGYVHRDGPRDNSKSGLKQGDLYLGYRPDSSQLWYVEFNGHDADAGDPGRISYPQFQSDPNFAPTPLNHNWVERYALTLGHTREFASGWLLDAKLFGSYQRLYSRAAAAQAADGTAPSTTTLQDDKFRNVGLDLRVRKRWGRGNAFTAGTVLYHSDAPFLQFTSTNLQAGRGEHSGTPRLNQERQSWYGAVFAENVFRLPHRFHVVLSGRLEHERLKVHESVRPSNLTRPLIDVDVSRTVPLLGIGIGNDFGHENETYFSITQGYRPLRFFDVASPFSNLLTDSIADPAKSLSFEAGVHGTPIEGLFYDASLFWIEFKNRIETQRLNATDVINVNSGDTRHRGFEGELSYDVLAPRHGQMHLVFFGNVSLLDAKFVGSRNPEQIGKTPSFAPHSILKGGVTFRAAERYSVSLSATSVSSQFFQDSNLPGGSGATFVPAKIPAYTVVDLSADWSLTSRLRLLGGISNLTGEYYYSRVFQTGLEPAPGRRIYVGAAVKL